MLESWELQNCCKSYVCYLSWAWKYFRVSSQTFAACFQPSTLIGDTGCGKAWGMANRTADSEKWSLIRFKILTPCGSLKVSTFSIYSEIIQRFQQIFKLYLSAVSEAVQVPLHHTQLPVLLLQASGVGRRTQGSDGTERVIKRPNMTPLNPPDKYRRPPQLVMAKEMEWLTASPTEDTAVRKMQIKIA